MSQRRYWFALHPDLTHPIGGVKQIHRLAEVLLGFGREVVLIQDSAEFHPGWFDSSVPTVARQSISQQHLDPSRDVVVLPETFVPGLPDYLPGIPKIIFNQNGSYTFNLGNVTRFVDPAKIMSLYRHPDVRAVLCVSEHDRALLAAGVAPAPDRVHRVVNSIEVDLFKPARAKQRCIAFMPRKQAARDAAIVSALLQSQPWFQGWRLMPIQGRPQAEVAELLQQAWIFLAFSQREGFGLPLVEASSCGCHLIGHTGLGGTEVFDLAAENGTADVVRDGDWLGFVHAMHRFTRNLEQDRSRIAQNLLLSSKAMRRAYAPEAMRASVAVALPRWEAQLDQPLRD